AAEMMRTDTALHADQAGGHVGKPCFHLATRPLLPQHNGATLIEADGVERVLTASPLLIITKAVPFGSRTVPIAREPSPFFTSVATRTNSPLAFTKRAAT